LRGILISQRPKLSHRRSGILAAFVYLFDTMSEITAHGNDRLSANRIIRD